MGTKYLIFYAVLSKPGASVSPPQAIFFSDLGCQNTFLERKLRIFQSQILKKNPPSADFPLADFPDIRILM